MLNPTRILVAGDHFVTPELVSERLRAATEHPLEIRSLRLPWPLEPFGPVAEVDEASGAEAELVEAIAQTDVVVTQMAPLTERVLRVGTGLRLAVCVRGGPTNVNLDAATSLGIPVCNAPGRNAQAAAEHAITLILAALRNVPAVHNSVVAGEWRSDLYAYDECGTELAGSTVGLIGYGAIGRRVARVLHAFDAQVLVADPYAAPDEPGITAVDLDELLAASDIISLHARLTPETESMIDTDALAKTRRGAYLVNTSRGGLVDYQALTAALAEGQLSGAAMDVFPMEPPPQDWPLRSAPNVVLTPHLAGATKQTAHRAADMATQAVTALLDGRDLPHVCNPQAVAGPA